MTVTVAPPSHDKAALTVLDRALKAVDAYDRPDLRRRLTDVRARVLDPRVRVLVVGEFKQGKSSLVNGIVNAPVCPVDDDVATSVPTAVHYADPAQAVALLPTDGGDADPRREPVDVGRLGDHVSEVGNPSNERNLFALEVGVPRQILRSGLVLVDTPGVGGLGSAHSATTIGALPSADAVLLVTDASQELTEPELTFLRLARDLCPTVACVLTKTDFHPQWRRIADLDRAHLQRHGLTTPVLPTSATLRQQAAARDDPQLNAESGYPALLAYLRDQIVGSSTQLTRRAVTGAVGDVTDQLEGRFAAERQALADPRHSAALVADLERAQEHAATLRGRAARWQQTLSDGFADLAADAEYDLRERMRSVLKKAEAAIAETDPGKVWEEMEQWLYRMVTHGVAEHYAMVTDRAGTLSAEIAAHFSDDESATTRMLAVHAPLERLRQIDTASKVDAPTTSLGAKGLTAMRGSYGGVMMIGMLGSVVGMGLINPLSLGFGVILGRKAIRDERERALAQRRQQARQACRGYVDDVTFQVGKDARDGLRRLQRQLRDTFTARAEELQRSTGDALNAAKEALSTNEAERTARLRQIDAELGRIRALREQAGGLA